MAEKHERQYAPDEVNEHGEYIKIGGAPVPGITLRHVLEGHTNYINAISWSKNGKYLCSGSADLTIRIWDLEKGELKTRFEATKTSGGEFGCVAWSPNGEVLAASSSNEGV